MKEDNQKIFVSSFDKLLKDKGFIKRGLYWKKQISDYWVILNLQKSQYGEYFYLNIGLSTKSVNNVKIQKTYEWSLATRYETIFVLNNKELLKLFDYSANQKAIQNNLKVVSKNLDFLLQIFYKLRNKEFIEKNMNELSRLINLSSFSIQGLQRVIKNEK